ncbi:hypothetical protein STENM327S_01630 [Streptomyces tendae]
MTSPPTPALLKIFRSAATQMATWVRAMHRGFLFQTVSTRVSTGTTRPGMTSSRARMVRWRAPPSGTAASPTVTVSGPKTLNLSCSPTPAPYSNCPSDDNQCRSPPEVIQREGSRPAPKGDELPDDR